MPKIDAHKKLENFIKSRRVVQMRDLFEVVQSTSRMTVFRRLSGVEYLCSYTHAGRYYTLFDIARFLLDYLQSAAPPQPTCPPLLQCHCPTPS